MEIKELSVFFPAVNEEGNIEATVKKAEAFLSSLGIKYEIIIVDDGSRDKTGEIVKDIADKNPKVRLVTHSKNLGYGSALKTGFKEARYEWVAFSDSDGQFDITELKSLMEKSHQVDLILGYRLNRADSFLRKVFTFGWGMIARVLLGLNVKDYSCGFKLIKKKVFDKTLPLEGEEKVTQIEFLVKAKRLGYKFTEVGVHHFPRLYGHPTGAKLSVVIKSLIDVFKLWWKINDHKLALLALLTIVLLAGFLRFYRLGDYMTFLGDEGRDALIIKKFLVEGDLPFIGPPTSVGNIYLGPMYYYMMSIPMVIFWLNPVSAAGMNAVIGVLTVVLIYYVGKKWFGEMAGLAGALLYSVSPITTYYSRSSWNPNPTPFFTLLAFFAMYEAHKSKNLNWLILTGIFTGLAMQMHYLAIILIPIFLILVLVERYRQVKNFFSGIAGGILGFILTLVPLMLFDLKHDFLNLRAFIAILSGSGAVGFDPVGLFSKIPQLYFDSLIIRYLTGDIQFLGWIIGVIILLPFLKRSWYTLALGVWLGVGMLFLGLYKGAVYDHYLGFLNPAPYLLFGALLQRKQLVVNLGVAGIIIILLYVNLSKNILFTNPNYQLEKTQNVAKLVIQQSGGERFNFALISKNNYDAAYQFYLDIYGYKPAQLPFEKADQLFVVCEDSVCDPTHSSKFEIVGFGWTRIGSMEQLSGVKIYKLISNPSGKP